jgi:hypothetical protein
MTDWSQLLQASPTHIHTYARFAAFGRGRSGPNTAAPAAATWVANTAVYIPFRITFPYLVQRMFWINGPTVTTTNVDCGVYNVDGSLLCSTGSVAMGTASALQYQAPTVVTLLLPGRYYLAWTCSNTTTRAFATTLAVADGQMIGIQQQATALPLPASMTPAAYSLGFVQFCGITRTASGF